MPEVRTEIPDDECGVLDAYCSATGKHRTDVVRDLLKVWSKNKLHEATIIMRVAKCNPTSSDVDRSQS